MGIFRKRVKNLLEKLTGYEIARFGDKSFILIDKKHNTDTWLSRNSQIKLLLRNLELIL